MESPVVLLKSAAFESDSYQRTEKVIKACKIITDILPYDKKSQVLIEESELMKYLMLTLPLNPKAIDLIILTMLDKFKKVHYFLKETWAAFLHIAQLEEGEGERKKTSALKLLQLGVRSLMKGSIKELSDQAAPLRGQNYNEQIMKNREMIKTSVLEYIEKILVVYLQELRSSIPFKPDIPDLIKKFLANTSYESVINRTIALSERIKDVDPEFVFGDDVEEMVTTKKDSQLNLKSLSSMHNLEDVKTPNNTRTPQGKDMKSPSGGTPMNAFKLAMSKKMTVLQQVEESKSDNSITEEEEDEDDEESTIKMHHYVEGANNQIEDWLSDFKLGDVPVAMKTPFVEEFLKDDMNFEMLICFIYNPRFHKISDCWKQKNPTLFNQGEESPFAALNTNNEGLSFKKLKEKTELHPYVLRSFKAMQLVCDERNYKILSETGFNLFERFFSGVYIFLTTKEDVACNLNHVLAVTDFLISKDAKKSVQYILQFNLPYKFLMNIEFPYTQRFFLNFFNCLPNGKEMDEENSKKIAEYCRLTSFFIDLSKAILNGPSTFPKEKLKAEYKPEGMNEIINLAPGGEGDLDICKIEKLVTKEPKIEPSAVVEELRGFELDIDGIKDSLQPIKKPTKKISSKGDKKPKNSMRNSLRRYPSLIEKHYYDDEDATTEGLTTQNLTSTDQLPEAQVKQVTLQVEPATQESKDSTRKSPQPSPSPQKSSMAQKKESPLKNNKLPAISTSQKATPNTTPTPKTETKAPNPTPKDAGAKPSPLPLLKDTAGLKEKVAANQKAVNDTPQLSAMTTVKTKEPGSATMGSKNFLSSYKGSEKEKTEYTAPERKNFIREFDMDVLGKKELEQLRELYPTSTKNINPSPLDKESKKPEYKLKSIKANDQVPVALCEFLDLLFQKMLPNGNVKEFEVPENLKGVIKNEELKAKYEMRRRLGASQADYSQILKVIFGDRAQVFNNLLTNYMIKIKVHHFEEINSGFISGTIVNNILQECKQNKYLKRFAETVHAICKENFSFFCKTLIQSYAWVNRTDLKVYLQDYEVQQPLGTGRIILAKTLLLMIQNDEENEYSILNDINDTCWHALIMQFFTKRTNNVYQEIFYAICEIVFLNSKEKFVLNILFKLNLIFNLYKTWTEIYQNNVLLKDNHIESIYAYIKKFTKLIDTTANTHEDYTVLKEQLATNASFNMLKSKLIVKPKEKKKNPADRSKSKNKSPPKHERNDTGSTSRRENLIGTASSMRPHHSPPDSSAQKKRP